MSSSKRKQPNLDSDAHHAKRLRLDSESRKEFEVVHATITMSIPPLFAADPLAGVEEMLDSMVMRYIPAFEGVVLTHANTRFMQTTATIKADCPFLIADVALDATVWSPRIGMQLVGKVSLCSPDHISLLIHETFNTSIPRNHIPTHSYEFEYGPAENDPEFAADEDDENTKYDPSHTPHSMGKWVHKVTGDSLGGDSGRLVFTVIGLTVANEMLSLVGSLQDEPFSTLHTAISAAAKPILDTIDHGKDDAKPEKGSENKPNRKQKGEREHANKKDKKKS